MRLAPWARLVVVAAAAAPFAAAQPCGPWAWSNPSPRPVALNGVASGNGIVLALGGNTEATSFDGGATWDVRDEQVPPFVPPEALPWWGWNDVIWDGTRFVAAGGPYVASSPDGGSWTLRYDGFVYGSRYNYTVHGIAFNGGRYVAIADNEWFTRVMTSTDLETWTPVGGQELLDVPLAAIAPVGSSFVAVGYAGGVLITGDASAILAVPGAVGGAVAFSGRELVAVSPTGVRRSLDGLTWNAVSAPRDGLNGVTWTGREFVAVGSDGAVIASPDGVVWEDRSIAVQYAPLRVISTGDRLVAVGNNILTSEDGVGWRPWATQATSAILYDVVWNGDAFVAVGARGEIVRSADGVGWTRTREPGGGFEYLGHLASTVWTGSRFVSVGDLGRVDAQGNVLPGAAIATSPDGASWTTTVLDVHLQSAAWNGERLLAVGSWSDGTTILVSEDQTTWQSVPVPAEWSHCCGFARVAALPGRFVALIGGNPAYASPNGEQWVKSNLPAGAGISHFVTGGDRFVAFGDEVLASADGVTWTPATGIGGAADVVWMGDQFLAWDRQGSPLRSDDGITWQPAPHAPPAPPPGVYALAAGHGQIVGVGQDGLIVRSPCAGTRPPARRRLGRAPGARSLRQDDGRVSGER